MKYKKTHSEAMEEVNLYEKSVSQQQQKFMGMVRAVQKGDMEAPSPEVAKAAKDMKKKDVKDFASTKHDELPVRKEATNPEDEAPASPDEGHMAVQQLEFMMHAVVRMKGHIEQGGKFPEWMQNKLSGAHEKLKGLYSNIEHGMKEEVESMDEGRKSKYDFSEPDDTGADRAVIMQIRKAYDLDGKFDVEFADGKTTKVSKPIAKAIMQTHMSLKPADRLKFQKGISKSYKGLLTTLKKHMGNKK